MGRLFHFLVVIKCLYIFTGITAENKFNVVFIIIDDFRCPPEKSVSLPNFEKLAANGIEFENAFAQQALCAPSRNSMLTGRRPDALHLYDFYSYWRTSVDKYKDAAVCKDTPTAIPKKNLLCPVKVTDQPEGSLPDIQSVDYAKEILSKRKSNKPFFLAVGFHKPHIPFKYPQKYLDRIPLKKVHPPKHPYMPLNMPTVAWHPWTDVRRRDDIHRLNISFPYGIMPSNWALKVRQNYYAAETYIDDLLGILMGCVNRNDTIVVLTSDHGWSLGENGLWAKYSNFDVALKVPLIFNIPNVKHKSIESPVELIDIFPTLVQLSGIKANIPKCSNTEAAICFDGQSLVPLMTSETNRLNSKLFAISQYPRPSVYPKRNSDKPRLKDIKIMGYSIRTKRYRYTEWISFNSSKFTRNWDINYGVELYDHIRDPNEAYNVGFVSTYQKIVALLSKKLRAQIEN
ncbi:iduronate 2-sulfatase isoform X3 [Amyelois transitella]|uniref:iduronate 2-sulfatase isoform X3 n=1 Tax=Amyelois transitella TaxID=680683 RepID=UPI0029906177|nr:iduronate 2-sulfatase isoform X3 [Amyelois transitella]